MNDFIQFKLTQFKKLLTDIKFEQQVKIYSIIDWFYLWNIKNDKKKHFNFLQSKVMLLNVILNVVFQTKGPTTRDLISLLSLDYV